MRKALRAANDDAQEVIRKFQDDWREELAPVDALRKEGKPVVGHDEYLDAEMDANKAISGIFSAEVEIDLTPIKTDAFLAACGDDELTLEQIAFLQENGILEE